ncbi:hypothetical protein RhiirC2_790232 [Rhizophagus irregularis]|uniref:RNase H type-1 domain-containing protein n=1 Tax=Rhizophagus irregularis TaxID=588596 RepID=A0A2N1MLL5_9GLOM|nr:hypothetical protein RhiirC2_790232 [Rhizophagus irregularis]
MNNCILWNALKHIIDKLNLQVNFIKVKAHSNNNLNDAADLLAKDGRTSPEHFNINVSHLPNQPCHLKFNDDIIIDRNIRKSINRIINFQYMERHISHHNLSRIKYYTLQNLIDWEYTQLWFKYNSFSKPTSQKYSKHISWRIKCSSFNLPTLDILNRNYPDLLHGYDTCFLCEQDKECNYHFWNCPEVLKIITPIFKKHYTIFKNLITSGSNSTYALYSDSITRCTIFRWTRNIPNSIKDIPDLHCFLLNYIPIGLSYPFKAAKISKAITKKILLKFIFDLYKDIYESVWKQRSQSWKSFKHQHALTKSQFINYHRDHTYKDNSRQQQRQLRCSDFRDLNTNQGYHCPFNDSRRHVDSNTLWIYLTSSNFLHNLPWISTLDNDLSQFHSYIFNNILFLI